MRTRRDRPDPAVDLHAIAAHRRSMHALARAAASGRGAATVLRSDEPWTRPALALVAPVIDLDEARRRRAHRRSGRRAG